MPEAIPDDLRALRERLQVFCTSALPAWQQRLDAGADRAGIEAEVRAAAREIGTFPMTQPRAFGGSEAGPLALTVARETLAAANSPLTRLMFGPGPGVLSGATGSARARYLEPLLRGERRAAFAFTEPADAPRHTAARFDGDHVVIDGAKAFVTGGATADFVNVLVEFPADTAGGGGRAMVIVDRATPGVTVQQRFSSIEGGSHVAMLFAGARVPRDNLVGRPGEGVPRALRQIGDTRLLMAAESCGLMLWVDAFVSRHITAAHRSGEPLAAREGVRLRYADLRIDAYVARSTLYRTARVADSGANAVNEVVAAKVFCTEALARVVDTGIQLVGGRALVDEHPLAVLYRRIRSLRIAEGASDVLRLNLVKGHLDLQKGRL